MVDEVPLLTTLLGVVVDDDMPPGGPDGVDAVSDVPVELLDDPPGVVEEPAGGVLEVDPPVVETRGVTLLMLPDVMTVLTPGGPEDMLDAVPGVLVALVELVHGVDTPPGGVGGVDAPGGIVTLPDGVTDGTPAGLDGVPCTRGPVGVPGVMLELIPVPGPGGETGGIETTTVVVLPASGVGP